MKNMKNILAELLVLVMFLSCVAFAETAESYDGVLVSEGMMDINYAKQFTIEKFKGGYRLVTDNNANSKILVVPEGMSVPAELEEGTQVLQLPVTKVFVDGSNVVNMCDAIGAIEKVRLVGTDTIWRFDSIKQQIESGYTQYAGEDYEMIATGEVQLAVWSGYDEESFNKLRALNICVITEQNTGEPGLYGRMEWMRCLGVLFGVEEQSEAHYAEQMQQIEAVRAEGDTDLLVGMGALSATSGKYYGRKSADFQADYIRYAGGIYNMEEVDPGKGGSATLTGEDFYMMFKDCDVLIWSQTISGAGNSNDHADDECMEALVELYPSIVDFKAYQNDQIYVQSSSYIQTGAGNPACIVNDIHTILTSDDPDVTTDHIIHLPWAADLQ